MMAMIIDKSNLDPVEKDIAETCDNAILQIHSACFGALAVLQDEHLYGLIKNKIPEEQRKRIDDIIIKTAQLHEATQ